MSECGLKMSLGTGLYRNIGLVLMLFSFFLLWCWIIELIVSNILKITNQLSYHFVGVVSWIKKLLEF